MALLGYKILLKKYLLIDLGVLLLLIVLPAYASPTDVFSVFRKAILYSGFLTPAISYMEVKRSHQLPFFDNLGVSFPSFYTCILLLKIGIAAIMTVYV